MRATILFVVLVVFFTGSGLVLENMETVESTGRGEAQANEWPERHEVSQMNGAPQYTFVWTSFSLGAL
ncbi:MAG: hypothetical protein ACWGQW_22200 [bacterium]